MEEEESAHRKYNNDDDDDSSSSTKELYPMGSPLIKKRKLPDELNDPRSPSLKHKFRNRLHGLSPESLTTESLGYDGNFFDKNSDTDMVNRVEERESDEDTESFIGACGAHIESCSKGGSQKPSAGKLIWDQPSKSSSSSNEVHASPFASCDSTATKEANSMVHRHLVNDCPIETAHVDMNRLCNVLEAYDDLIITQLMKNNMESSDHPTEDAMLYSNGVNDCLLSSAGQIDGLDGRASAKKLTIDQEFEQYFSMLML